MSRRLTLAGIRFCKEGRVRTYLHDRGGTTIVLVGDKDFPDILDKFDLLADQFYLRLTLDPMEFGSAWNNVIRNFQKELPFEASVMTSDKMPERLHVAARGKLPILSNLTRRAAMAAAFEDRNFVLALRHFEKAYGGRWPGKLNPFAERTDPLSPG